MVSAAFITYGSKILLFHRDDNLQIKDPDCWDIIGGHIDEGENPEQALKREINEEIGLQIANPELFKKVVDVWGAETYLYFVELNQKQANSVKLGDEGQEIRFFTFDELPNIKKTQNLSRYIVEFAQNLKSSPSP